MAELAKVRDEEIAHHEKRERKFHEDCAAINEIKERMKRDRRALKKLEASKRDYFAHPLFPRTDAARDAAWLAAVEARRQAQERGEPLRLETVAQCGARQKDAVAIYTP
ncbi:MAG TPA: hypothetical protein VG838_00610 [Opitutaceae bacterium]|nr:hypothetical protein [Opitutaceae bacterium]